MRIPFNSTKGQNVLEYLLLVMAVLITLIVIFFKDNLFKSRVQEALNATVNMIDSARNEINFGIPPASTP